MTEGDRIAAAILKLGEALTELGQALIAEIAENAEIAELEDGED